MGAFSVFGQFLKGYTESRAKKQADRRAQDEADMNTAMQWATIADRTSNDSIREMATKNMQNLIMDYEKRAGEKQGLGSLIKMFGSGQNKKDSASILNKIAPILARPVELDTTRAGDTSVDALFKTRGGLKREITEALPPEPNRTAEAIPEGLKMPGAPMWTEQATAMDEAKAPEQITPTGPPPVNGALQRARVVAQNIAPNRSVFFPEFAGGTRYSPTNKELEDQTLAMHERKLELENRITSDANLHNLKQLEAYKQELRQKQIDENMASIESTDTFKKLTPQEQERIRIQVTTGANLLEPTEYEQTPTGGYIYEGDKVYQMSGSGKKLDVTPVWRKENDGAAWVYDSLPSNNRSYPMAMKRYGEMMKGAWDTDQRYGKERIEALKRQVKQGNLAAKATLVREFGAVQNLLRTRADDVARQLAEAADRVDQEINSWVEWDKEDYAKSLLKPFPRDEDGNIVGKQHPYESLEEYRRLRIEQMTGIPYEIGSQVALYGYEKGSQVESLLQSLLNEIYSSMEEAGIQPAIKVDISNTQTQLKNPNNRVQDPVDLRVNDNLTDDVLLNKLINDNLRK